MKNIARRSIFIVIFIAFFATHCLAQVQTFCSNISGNIACSSYDHGNSSQSYCTSIAGNLTCTTYADDNTRIQIRQNYEIGQIVGTALGATIMSAIEEYRLNKRIHKAKQDEWNQFVQDTLSASELACEADPSNPKNGGTTVVGCRTMVFTLNQFLRLHIGDFAPDGHNIGLLADAMDKTAPADQSSWTEQTYETAFRAVDKKRLDKKIYLGLGTKRQPW